MTDPTLRPLADLRFERALAETGARDPRDFYRQRLRELKERNPDAFRQALDYYENRLIPAVAAEGSDPIREWMEYGRFLARLIAEGRTVQVDTTGAATDFAPPIPTDHLVLHLPAAAREPALVVGLPPEMSPAQRATYDLLVKGRRD